jgi:hypothetical protein
MTPEPGPHVCRIGPVTSPTIRAAGGVVAALAVAGLAACGGQPMTDLSITVSNGFGQQQYHLTCDPDRGDKLLAGTLCALLNDSPDVMLFGPTNLTCVGGIGTVHLQVIGEFDGRSIDTPNGIDGCSGNPESERLWLSGLTLPPNRAGSQPS